MSDAQRALLAAAASASTATLSLRERRAWILQLHGEGVSVRGIRDVLLHRFGPTEALSVGAIKAFLKQAVVNRMIDVPAKMSDAAGMKPVVDAAYGHVLGLAALKWNVEKREEGPWRGTSPYSLLGVLEEADERRWWEVLLDAQEEKEKAPAQAA